MPKGYRPYLPDQDLLLPPSLREWLPEEHLVYFVSDVVDQSGSVGDSRGVREREARAAAIRSASDDEVVGVRLLHGGVQFAPDPEAVAGRHRVQGAGGGQRAGLPHDFGLSQDPLGDAARTVRAGLGDGAGSGGDESGPGGAGRDEGESQRQQAQGDELRTGWRRSKSN